MNYKKSMMWLFLLLTALTVYVIFNHPSIPLLYAYLIYPFVISLGLAIAGFVGRGYSVGKIILRAVIGAFLLFILLLIIVVMIGGLGIVYWIASIFLPVFNSILLFAIIISGLIHSSKFS